MDRKPSATNDPESVLAPSSEDASDLDALLRQAAHCSEPRPPARSLLPSGSVLASGRLSVTRPIGRGGMGVVYEAFDFERRTIVALKTLSRLDANGVYRLKNEFRSLCDVSHPNLVRLYDLFADGGRWFFTMELVAGERFDRWVRPLGAGPGSTEGMLDESRLRSVLPQLLAGLEAIHAAGKLHRDIKPGNVLVTSAGRAVLLDFGLASDPEPGGVGRTLTEETASGTPAYMAPEQAAGNAATRASDFYALGVMLFEALTGRLPFVGHAHEMLTDKQRSPAPAVLRCCAQAPADLAACCDALLQHAPSERPDAQALRQQLGKINPERAPALGGARELLLGRDDELAVLRAQYDAACAGRPVCVFVVGESGIGKSALVGCFLEALQAETHAAVMTGRCHERESVPFNGFDSAVDDLSRFLRKLPAEEVAALLPRDVFALARVFPVLNRIDPIALSPHKDIADSQVLRQRAFAAFSELLARLRDRRPVVLHIDDAQWLDRDSVTLLDFLLSHQDATPVLLIVSYRSEGAATDRQLAQLRGRVGANPSLQSHELALGPLSHAAACALARCLLTGADESRLEQVAVQARGSPFLLGELARLSHASGTADIRLSDVLLAHVRGRTPRAQQLLEVLAVAARPVGVGLALRAAGAGHEQLDELFGARLVASHGAGEQRALSCYHDKIRESLTAALAADRARSVHARLLAVMLEQGGGEDEHIALHAEAAGELGLAARHAAAAGAAASAALAFERAAALYQRSLKLGQHDDATRRALLEQLGNAFANAGRGADAAHAFLEAARGASEQAAFDLERRAAKQWLFSGHVEAGKALLDKVLRAVGVRLPRSPKYALLVLIWEQVRLALRGLAFRPRSDQLPAAIRRELDALQTGMFLGAFDIFTAAVLQFRYGRRALDSGEPGHAAIGLSAVASCLANSGARTSDRVAVLLERAEELARASASHNALAEVSLFRALIMHSSGTEGPLVMAQCQAALELLSHVPDSWLFRSTVRSIYYAEAFGSGQRVPVAELAELVEDGVQRGDASSMIYALHAGAVGRLCQGDEQGFARHLEQARRYWQRPRNYSYVDFMLLMAEMLLALYRNEPARALERIQSDWPAIKDAELLRAPELRYALLSRRALAAHFAAIVDPARAVELQAIVRRDVRAAVRVRFPGLTGTARLLQAMLAIGDGDEQSAIAHAKAAITECERTTKRTHRAAARRMLGTLTGGDEGAALVNQAETELRTMGIVDVEAALRVL